MKIHSSGKNHYFWCPGCKEVHGINDTWQYNGDADKPTITPSVLVNGNIQYQVPGVPLCHSFVTNGKIRFLSDCTHDLADRTVDLPEWELKYSP